MKTSSEISYLVDAEDRIVSVDGEWSRFAAENDGAELQPDKVVGRPLWDFIADEATQELYQHVLERVRSGQPTELILRCDAPDRRRLIEMRVTLQREGTVAFNVHQLCERSRQWQPLLAKSTPRTTKRVLTCSWCNRVHAGTEEWLEVEDAINRLELTGEAELPWLEFVICPDCFAKVTEILTRKDPLQSEGFEAA
jgi:hypothetical protein